MSQEPLIARSEPALTSRSDYTVPFGYEKFLELNRK
jgi:hypothetical protein